MFLYKKKGPDFSDSAPQRLRFAFPYSNRPHSGRFGSILPVASLGSQTSHLGDTDEAAKLKNLVKIIMSKSVGTIELARPCSPL